MTEKGTIITYGKKAVTIQDEKKEQFYAPFDNIEDLILPFLTYPLKPIHVTYDIDYTNYSHQSNKKKRYYAINVKILDTVIF